MMEHPEIVTVTRQLGGLKEINQNPNEWYLIPKEEVTNPKLQGLYVWHHNYQKYIGLTPRYHIGEVVFVREAYSIQSGDFVLYRMDCETKEFEKSIKWFSPRIMPAWAARTFRRITDVRPERLHEITPADVVAEGVLPLNKCGWLLDVAQLKFQLAWDPINPKQKWDTNPFVFRYAYEYVSPEELPSVKG